MQTPVTYNSYINNVILKYLYGFKFEVFSHGRNATSSATDFSKCGVNYCPAPAKDNEPVNITENETAEEEDNFTITTSQRYILAGVYLICSVLSAVIVAIAVDPLSK